MISQPNLLIKKLLLVQAPALAEGSAADIRVRKARMRKVTVPAA